MKGLEPADASTQTFEDMVHLLVTRVATGPGGEHALELLLLIRSSGNERADYIRRATMHSYTEWMAETAGWSRNQPDTDHLLLRAQIAIATGFGIVLLRASTGLEPLTSATEDDLAGPLGDVVKQLLGASQAVPCQRRPKSRRT